MKKILIILFLLILNVESNAQYIEYYNLVNKANEYRYKKAFGKSLQLFQEGFQKVEYVHAANYVKAALTATKLKDYDLTQDYLSKAMKAGYPMNLIYQKPFKGFRKSRQYLDFKNHHPMIEKEVASKFNKIYQRKIDSLHYIDQRIIRGNDRVKGFNMDMTLRYDDASNFECLLGLIERFGFPSEQIIGYQGYRKAWIIIHHSARLVENHAYHTTLLDYVKSGEYLPENYCWVIDQGQEQLHEALIYYHWDVAKNIDELTSKEIEAIDKRRQEVGLASVRRIEVVRKSKVKINKVRW